MGHWTTHDPGAGDLDCLAHRIRRLRDQRDHASDLHRSLARAADATADFWRGSGRTQWCARVDETVAAWGTLHHWAETEITLLRRYVAAVESIAERARLHRSLLADAQDAVAEAGDDADAVESSQQSVAASTRALEALAEERREADSALVRDLGEVRTLSLHVRPTRLPAAQDFAGMAPGAILTLLGGLRPQDLEKLLARDPALVSQLNDADPHEVARWWSSLDDPQALIDLVPSVVGALDGVPSAARVAANRLVAQKRLEDDTREKARLEQLGPWETRRSNRRVGQLATEMDYLQRVSSGTVQLYLYDPDASRIIEMIGTPGPATKNVITYVPGTFTNMAAFYSNGVQSVARFLRNGHKADTVAFVYKDGKFPGEDDDAGSPNMLRIVEANNLATGLISGEKLARFESGIRATGLDHAKSIAVGHSWGLADITSSEVAGGAHYDQVFSLSGAWVPPEWKPGVGTTYTDLSYDDILQDAGRFGVLHNVLPRLSGGFDALPYFTGPKGMDGMKLHNLVASVDQANLPVLDYLKKKIHAPDRP